jgi:DNA-binding NtrC family response regulator
MSTILLVEDDDAVRRVLHEHLVEAGYQVIAVPDTTTASQAMVRAEKVDLLVADLVMPTGHANGLAFAASVQAEQPGLPVVFITGYYGFVARSGDLPGTVLYKPVDLEMLSREISVRLNA